MMQRGNASLLMGANSWKEQFLEAFTVQAGEKQQHVEGGLFACHVLIHVFISQSYR